MGDIYRQAEKVHVWLGENEDRVDRIFPFLNQVARLRISCPELAESSEKASVSTAGVNVLERQISRWLQSKDRAATLTSFFRRPWFRRRWVIQEVLLSTFKTVHCGKFKLHWTFFKHGILTLHWHFLSNIPIVALPSNRWQESAALENMQPAFAICSSASDDFRRQMMATVCSLYCTISVNSSVATTATESLLC